VQFASIAINSLWLGKKEWIRGWGNFVVRIVITLLKKKRGKTFME
jgi:hypothetical protein